MNFTDLFTIGSYIIHYSNIFGQLIILLHFQVSKVNAKTYSCQAKVKFEEAILSLLLLMSTFLRSWTYYDLLGYLPTEGLRLYFAI